MIYIEAPNLPKDVDMKNKFSIFIGGGITNCPPWNSHVTALLGTTDLVVINPRRSNFGGANAQEQIEWEHRMLHAVDMILFWFPEETLCPITLFELGSWLNHPSQKPVFIGTHPNYQRGFDVEIQTRLAQPNRKFDIVHHPDDIVSQMRRFLNGKKKRSPRHLVKDFYK